MLKVMKPNTVDISPDDLLRVVEFIDEIKSHSDLYSEWGMRPDMRDSLTNLAAQLDIVINRGDENLASRILSRMLVVAKKDSRAALCALFHTIH